MAEVKRLNYFTSQFLVQEDFQDEQAYHREQLRHHNQTLHTWGVAAGLAVEPSSTSQSQVIVQAGVAVDSKGRQIILPADPPPTPLDLTKLPVVDSTVYLTIAYQEVFREADRYQAGGVDNYSRTTEQPFLAVTTDDPRLDPNPPENPPILLAAIQLDGLGNIAKIDPSVRQLVGAKVAPGAIQTSQLANNSVTLDKLDPSSVQAAELGGLATTGGELTGSLYITTDVADSDTAYGLSSTVTASVDGDRYGLYGTVSGGTIGRKYGVYGTAACNDPNPPLHGGYFEAGDPANNPINVVYGVYGRACNDANTLENASEDVYGVYATAGDGRDVYGGFFRANGNENSSIVHGIYSQVISGGSAITYGISCNVSYGGTKFGGLFSVNSPDDQDAYGLYSTINAGDGGGNKYGVYSYIEGGSSRETEGTKYGVYAKIPDAMGESYSIYGVASTNVGTHYAGYFEGNVHVQGNLSKSSGGFLIDHPLDPLKQTLWHGFVESPENLCLYRGQIKLNEDGQATVDLPRYFAALTKEEEATVQLTPIGSKPFLVSYEWNSDYTAVTIFGNSNAKVAYLVMADRDDPAIRHHRKLVEQEKGNGNFEKGKLLNPEAYGYPESMRVS